jgi:hypothetical protein
MTSLEVEKACHKHCLWSPGVRSLVVSSRSGCLVRKGGRKAVRSLVIVPCMFPVNGGQLHDTRNSLTWPLAFERDPAGSLNQVM